ncbi:hypothetical protein RT723_03640 [Psychrosphaera aquimarina]|uniref:Uncharacterized protein n=1 Tax=Psychrosphaera aquimarina TaxID=2044854 RepID=A0ABU3QXE1_9GAMM|nr:hypothetical protein [Psychrosphaera aquimarina]MDU0112106.1 hypothetical protein [Psychrosphaera aquimarina]
MSISNYSVTAGVEQTKVASRVAVRTKQAEIIDKVSQIPTAAELTRQNSQNVHISGNLPQEPQIESEQVRVSSTTGQSDIRGNLSPVQAAKIYEKIARLI